MLRLLQSRAQGKEWIATDLELVNMARNSHFKRLAMNCCHLKPSHDSPWQKRGESSLRINFKQRNTADLLIWDHQMPFGRVSPGTKKNMDPGNGEV